MGILVWWMVPCVGERDVDPLRRRDSRGAAIGYSRGRQPPETVHGSLCSPGRGDRCSWFLPPLYGLTTGVLDWTPWIGGMLSVVVAIVCAHIGTTSEPRSPVWIWDRPKRRLTRRSANMTVGGVVQCLEGNPRVNNRDE